MNRLSVLRGVTTTIRLKARIPSAPRPATSQPQRFASAASSRPNAAPTSVAAAMPMPDADRQADLLNEAHARPAWPCAEKARHRRDPQRQQPMDDQGDQGREGGAK